MRAPRRTRFLRPSLLLLVGTAFLPSPALAQEGGSGAAPAGDTGGRWSVQPAGEGDDGQRANFAYNLAPGQRITDTVAISNLSDAPITFDIYPKDAYNTPQDAAFALQDDADDPTDVGSWVRLATNEYTIPPQTRVEVPFEVAVPDDAEPGDHAGGIIAADVEPVSTIDQNGVAIAVRQRIATRIYVRVDGPVDPALQVTQLDVQTSSPLVPWLTGNGDMTITYQVSNVGNVRLDPSAEVEVTGVLGRQIRALPVQDLPELLPGSSVQITQNFSGLPPFEPVTARVKVTTPDGEVTTSRSSTTFVWSWGAVAVPVLVLVAVLGRRRWRNGRARPEPRSPASGRDAGRTTKAPAKPRRVDTAPEKESETIAP